MSLPPELASLDSQYDQLVADAEAGHISQADALSTLAGLSVTDADGAVWALNADGDFVRAPFPGAPAQVVDPATFATTPTPQAPYATDPYPTSPLAPAAAPGFPTPPSVPATPLAPVTGPATPAGLAWPAPADALSTPPVDMTKDVPPGAPSAATPLQVPPHPAAPKNTRSIAEADRPRPLAAITGRARDWVSANRVLVGILAVGAALLAVLALQSGNTPAGTTLPTGPDATGTSTTPAADGGETMPTETAAVPTKAQATDAISSLTSGRKDLVAAVAVARPDNPSTVRAAALWAGAKELGLRITPGAAAANGAGAVQRWTVTDGRTTIATVTVTWVRDGQSWKLTELPTF